MYKKVLDYWIPFFSIKGMITLQILKFKKIYEFGLKQMFIYKLTDKDKHFL